jgi:hypothetical protein
MKKEIYTPCHFEAGVLHDGIVYMDVCDFKGDTVRIYNKKDFGIDGKVEALRYLADLVSKNELPYYMDQATYAKRMEEWTDDIEEVYASQNEKEDNEVKYVVCEDLSKVGGWNISINGQEIDDKVFDEDMVEYVYIDRADLIVDIQSWLCEARQAGRTSDAQLMDEDIDYLKTLKDNYVFSSRSTNDYVAFSDNRQKFNEICEGIIEANDSIKQAQ